MRFNSIFCLISISKISKISVSKKVSFQYVINIFKLLMKHFIYFSY